MARGPGKQVKSFKTHIPQADQSAVEIIAKVMFHADDGSFSIAVPDHIGKTIPPNYKPQSAGETRVSDKGVTGNTMAEVIKAFEQLLAWYKSFVRDADRKRMIRVILQANERGHSDYQGHKRVARLGYSTTQGPALHFRFEVVFQSGSRLFTIDSYGAEGERLGSDIGSASEIRTSARDLPGSFLMDWTPEREAVMQQMADGFDTLIDRIIVFMLGDLTAQVDQIAAGGVPLLAAPTPPEES